MPGDKNNRIFCFWGSFHLPDGTPRKRKGEYEKQKEKRILKLRESERKYQ